LHWLDQPTNGAVDAHLPDQVLTDQTALNHLLDSGSVDALRSQRYRERLAISVLLPAFNRGLSRMEAGELARQERTGTGTHKFD